MLFNKYINKNKKILISVIIGGIWIYFRTDECYKLIPRKNLISVILVIIWIVLNYKDPLFLPIGLFILYIYSILF